LKRPGLGFERAALALKAMGFGFEKGGALALKGMRFGFERGGPWL